MSSNPNAIVAHSADELSALKQKCEALVASGFLPAAIRTWQQAYAIITMARELGIGDWAGLNGINVIQGRATVSPQLMLAMINSKGHMEDMQIGDDGSACTVVMKRRGRSPHTYSFSMTDALTMGLSNKDNWKKQPAIMRQWRAVAGCARIVFPDDIMNLYTPEEMGADVIADDQGNMTIVGVEREDVRLLPGSGDEPVVTSQHVGLEVPSASVSGAGLPKPIQPIEEEDMRPDETETPLNEYVCDVLKVHETKTTVQFLLKVKRSATNILVKDMAAFEGLTVNDMPVVSLRHGEYPLIPTWTVTADSLPDGSWHVLGIQTAIPV